jgi:hypothetical protein
MGLFQEIAELAGEHVVACDDAAGSDHVVAAGEVGDKAARLAHEDDAGGEARTLSAPETASEAANS